MQRWGVLHMMFLCWHSRGVTGASCHTKQTILASQETKTAITSQWQQTNSINWEKDKCQSARLKFEIVSFSNQSFTEDLVGEMKSARGCTVWSVDAKLQAAWSISAAHNKRIKTLDLACLHWCQIEKEWALLGANANSCNLNELGLLSEATSHFSRIEPGSWLLPI